MILTNANICTLLPGDPYGLMVDAAVVIEGEEIVWVGDKDDLPAGFSGLEKLDVEGRVVTPGLIDCHSHVVFGGNRSREFELRLQGASYEQIAREGGGIVSTVRATREASEEDLLEDALLRVDHLISEGVCVLEIKSGYGLDVDTELKMLRVARRIQEARPIKVKTSFLGAHAVPREFADLPDRYLDEICIPAMQKAHGLGLVDAVDGFCEGIAFTPAQIEKVFKKSTELGLPVKLHAEQLSNLGGAKLAARYNALSADHLEYLDMDGVKALAGSGSVAVLLPGAFYTLRETRLPPVALLRDHGVPMAVATDCNPGSSPLSSLLLAMNMACTLFRMTPEETLRGATQHAAAALGLENQGTIEPGNVADLCIWNVKHPAELSYRIGYNPLWKRVCQGQVA